MDTQSWLIVIVGVSLGSYLFRASPFIISAWVRFPGFIIEWLVLLSISIIAGLISKTLFIRAGTLNLTEGAMQLAAVAVAGAVHRTTKNIIISLGCGVGMAVILKMVLAGG